MKILKEVLEEIDAMILKEILNEGNIVKGSSSTYGISVNNDMGGRFMTLPYFKFFLGNNPSNAIKMARIPICGIMSDEDAKYIYQNHSGTERLVLTNPHFKILDKMLRSKSPVKKFLEVCSYGTVWENIIYDANEIIKTCSGYTEIDLIPMDLEIPNYKSLLKEK